MVVWSATIATAENDMPKRRKARYSAEHRAGAVALAERFGVAPDKPLPVARVVRALDQIGSVRGLPERSRIEKGCEILARMFTD